MAHYDQFDIDLARQRQAGAPDPEGDAVRANLVLDLIARGRIEEAAAAIPAVLDPVWQADLRTAILLDRECLDVIG